MRICLTGANGVMGAASIHALHAAGHEVSGLVRTEQKAAQIRSWGAHAVLGDLFDPVGLARAMRGCDAVVNFATKVPVGLQVFRPGSLDELNRIRSEGAELVARLAIELGVGRMIQQSVSFVYSDSGDTWINESTPVDVNHVTEPLVIAEGHARKLLHRGGTAISLRYGLIVGDDANTRYLKRRARARKPIGIGSPDSWLHVIHPDDIGTSLLGALSAPSGTYNVGADPVTRRSYVDAIARAVGREHGSFVPRWQLRLAGQRLEPLARSQRVSSALLTDRTGWKPSRPELQEDWFRD